MGYFMYKADNWGVIVFIIVPQIKVLKNLSAKKNTVLKRSAMLFCY